MTSTVWEIAAVLDEARTPAEVPNSVWLEIPTARLRGPEARQDNVWLRECLERLMSVKLSGDYRGDPWGAVVLAEWHITQGGSMARLLIPPAGIYALRSPANFTKIEAYAAHRLTGHARRLYALLADKKNLGRPSWTWRVEEIRRLLGVDDKRAYDVWAQFRKRVLDPAVAAINDYGTVSVTMVPEKLGRAVDRVRFEWRWKDVREAAELASEGERQVEAPAKAQVSAKVLVEPKTQPVSPREPRANPVDPAVAWWDGLTEAEREAWADRAGRTFEAGGFVKTRRKGDLARAAYALLQAEPDAPKAPEEKPELLEVSARRRAVLKRQAEEAAERKRTGQPAPDTRIRPPPDILEAVQRRKAKQAERRTARLKPS